MPVSFTAAQERARVLHGVGSGLLHVRITACLDCFDAVQGVLKIGGGDHDGIDVLARIEFVVVATLATGLPPHFFWMNAAPSSRRRFQISETATNSKLSSLACSWNAGTRAPLARSPAPIKAHPDAIVGANDGGVARRV